MEEKHCTNCRFATEAGYRQIICGKSNKWESENYHCHYWAERISKVKGLPTK